MRQKGFTLIELSIVLVIIGLIIGGVLVGQDLIVAATVRAQVTQIEKYQAAVNTFKGKYGYLPGDIPDPTATQFGFSARGAPQCAGEGDGNGILQGGANVVCSPVDPSSAIAIGVAEQDGENPVFWRDLATANLIDGGPFSGNSIDLAAGDCEGPGCFPVAKLNNISVYVWSGGAQGTDGHNYFGISSVVAAFSSTGNIPVKAGPTPGLTVAQAHAIDVKIDDGLPQTGRVTALYLDDNQSTALPVWAASGPSATATTCFDVASGGYSVGFNNGGGFNCGISIQFQ